MIGRKRAGRYTNLTRKRVKLWGLILNLKFLIIAKSTLRAFYEQPNYTDSKSALEAWYHEVLKLQWTNPNEIKMQYRSASVVDDNKIVFNICGNKYLLIVKINYEAGIVFIKFIGTHKAYDKIKIEEL